MDFIFLNGRFLNVGPTGGKSCDAIQTRHFNDRGAENKFPPRHAENGKLNYLVESAVHSRATLNAS
jgi:hypothetical protein